MSNRRVERDDSDRDPEPRGFDPAHVDSTASANQLEVSRVFVELESWDYADAAERLRFADPVDQQLLARRLRAEYLENDDAVEACLSCRRNVDISAGAAADSSRVAGYSGSASVPLAGRSRDRGVVADD